MFDIGWTELLLIGIVALIVVGPKELPGMFRKMGQMTGKARSLAREFQRAMETAADEAGVKDMQRDLRKITSSSSLGLDDLETSISSGLKASDFDADRKVTPPAKVTEAQALATDAGKTAAPKVAKPRAKAPAKTTSKAASATTSKAAPAAPETVSQSRKAASAAKVAGANARLTPAKKVAPVKKAATTAAAPKKTTKSDPA